MYSVHSPRSEEFGSRTIVQVWPGVQDTVLKLSFAPQSVPPAPMNGCDVPRTVFSWTGLFEVELFELELFELKLFELVTLFVAALVLEFDPELLVVCALLAACPLLEVDFLGESSPQAVKTSALDTAKIT